MLFKAKLYTFNVITESIDLGKAWSFAIQQRVYFKPDTEYTVVGKFGG